MLQLGHRLGKGHELVDLDLRATLVQSPGDEPEELLLTDLDPAMIRNHFAMAGNVSSTLACWAVGFASRFDEALCLSSTYSCCALMA